MDGDASLEKKAVKLEREKEEEALRPPPPPPPPKKKKKKAKKAAAKKERVTRNDPEGCKEILRGTEEMRTKKDAEVENHGCEVFFDESFPPQVCRYHVLIAAMMNSQTKDAVSAAPILSNVTYCVFGARDR
ncbi:Endonuclease III-like protein 1 [Phytophthora pseudosyringae]|uniref:Endonuclease III-like protein 1 n=1 Tax=Phytophthora pseudosyringae TaxID=221518 RepID=A0A8T1VIB0_9STRA|nr:Endonuclease III-like protein 1 [Phytophthora pseudosyringae]